MKRNIARTVALTLAIAFLLSMVSTTQVKQAEAAYTAKSWTFPVIDNWGKSLAKGEARGYLYNSTLTDAQGKKHYWGNWTLLASADVWTNSTGSYITFNNIPPTWNITSGVQYTLVIKLKISGSETPITIYNATVLDYADTNTLALYESAYPSTYYSLPGLYQKIDTGYLLQFGEVVGNPQIGTIDPVFPINADGFVEPPLRLWLYYVALKVVDESGLPLTVTDVKVTYSSNNVNNKTWITQSAISGIINGKYWSGTANGTYEAPNNGLVPIQEGGFHYEADCHVGWVIIRVPIIDFATSLVNNMTFLFYYHGTLVGNFSATDLTVPGPTDLAWDGLGGSGLLVPITIPPTPPEGIDGTVDPLFHSVGGPATLTANFSQYVVVNVAWTDFYLYDQEGLPWPTRNAKVTLYDTDLDNQYPWPGVINPDWEGAAANVLLRYPVVNHTLKVVITWFDCTVNVSYIPSNTVVYGGFDMESIDGVWRYRSQYGPGLLTDMVRLWVKVFTSTQVPAPLDPNWVDEVKIRIESRTAPQTTYITKLSYWHGYIILPDTPWGWWAAGGYETIFDDGMPAEQALSVGWLPNGSWTTIDFFVKFKGLEVVNTVTGYPVNTTLKLTCPGLLGDPTSPTDYDKTFILYAGVYDIGFQVLLGSTHDNTTAPEGTPLFITTPDMQRILVTTDGMGSVTLRDVPSGTYKDFVILYKMIPINCSNVKSVLINVSTKPLVKLLFPAFYLNITVWNFEGTFKLVNLNASFYNTVDYSKFGINNDLLRRALDVDRKRSVILPDDWAVLTPVAVTSPDIGDLIDYLGEDPMAYSTILYRTQLWITGRDADGELGDNGVPVWPMQLGLMPAANYSCRISVPNGTEKAVQAGFRPADSNATVYWSDDPYPGVGPIEVSARKAVDQTVSVNIYTYIYNVPVQTLDASGQPLKLADMSAVILAEPFNLDLGMDGNLLANGYAPPPYQLWYMQQWDDGENATTPPFYNAYMVRFNTTDANGANWFHSVNATHVAAPTDPDLGTNAHTYPAQSRYLIGISTLEPTEDNYTFNVYYQGVLVFNDSIPLTNPYTIGTAGHAVTGYHKIKTSVYPYVFEATNDPLNGDTFGIANLKVEVYWAGLNTTWWPTVNLTYRTAAEEFALLNASKLYKGFNMTVVKRMWGNVTGLETDETITTSHEAPYYSSFLKIVNSTTDSNGEFKTLVPVWNYSVGYFPTFMGMVFDNGTWLGDQCPTLTAASRVLNPGIEDMSSPFDITIGGPRLPWVKVTDAVNMTFRTESLFGTPVFVNYTTIPGKTNNVPALDDPRLVGVGPGYTPWINGSKAINATGLINPATVPDDELNGVSLTMNVLEDVRAYGTGVLVNNNVSKLIYGDFQGRSPELALIADKAPYKEEGKKIAPPQSTSNFFAKVDSETLANDLWVWVRDYAGNALAFQRVEIIRANYTFTRDDEDIVLQPELWTVQYTPRVWPYGPVKIASKPNSILWGFYDVLIRTTNLSDADVVGTTVVADRAKDELESLELYGHQWLYKWLKGGDVDWTSTEVELKWDAKLDVQIKAGDGSTPIEKAWVYLIYGTNWAHDEDIGYFPPNPANSLDPDYDPVYGLPAGSIDWGVWEIGQNATAGLTDAVGFAASLKVNNAQGPLATSGGTALNLGFNVYRDVYTVKVYYKFMGEDKLYGPVQGTVVWDTFTDQPQHRYIYLGVNPPATATGEDWSNAQHKIYAVRIWNLKLTIVDQSAAARPIAGAMVTVSGLGTVETASDGSVPFALAPAGTYSMTATWKSQYNPEDVTIAKSTIPLQATTDQIIPATVYDAELQLVSPSGKPISGAEMSLAGVALGMTGADGKVVAPQVPSKHTETDAAYPVTAMWLGIDVSPGPVTITSSRTYILTATNVATLTVQAVGAQGQGLSAAQVDIKNSAGTTVFSGVTNEQGIVNVEVPYDTYTVAVDYKGFTSTTTSTVDSAAPTPTKIATNVFVEIFGQAMTFATFVLWIIVIVIVVLVLAIVIHEYHVWRRKRLPQLFGAPRVPGA